MRKCKILFLIFFAVFMIASIAQTLTIEESVDIEGVTGDVEEDTLITVNYNVLPFGNNPGEGAVGLTDPHFPDVAITVVCIGNEWRLKVVSVSITIERHAINPYITPNPVPGGNITAQNYCHAINDLSDYLFNMAAGPDWHDIEATKAHENKHVEDFKNAFNNEWIKEESTLESLTVPVLDYPTQSEAIEALKKLGVFKERVKEAYDNAFAMALLEHREAYLAGQEVLDEIVAEIIKFAESQTFPSCPD